MTWLKIVTIWINQSWQSLGNRTQTIVSSVSQTLDHNVVQCLCIYLLIFLILYLFLQNSQSQIWVSNLWIHQTFSHRQGGKSPWAILNESFTSLHPHHYKHEVFYFSLPSLCVNLLFTSNMLQMMSIYESHSPCIKSWCDSGQKIINESKVVQTW